MGIFSRARDSLMHAAFNTFTKLNNAPRVQSWGGYSGGYGRNPSQTRMSSTGDKTVITAIYNQLAIDVASVPILHVKNDPETGNYESTMKSGLNYCLTQEANIDEGARAFRQNVAMTLFDKGNAAICIIEATADPAVSMSYEIETLRVGEVREWFPDYVRVLVYNQTTGEKTEHTIPKRQVAIVENPLYAVMNDEVSTLKRLTRKLNLLDAIDEQSGSGKLDIIIQLPYAIKSETKKQQAQQRRADMEDQLKDSRYGVAYADATEKITQLNRPAENNMLAQVEFLTKQLYSQLGVPKAVFDGEADEKTMIAYQNRTVEPILTAITEAMERKFISKTARTQGQAVRFYPDPFKNASLVDIATVTDVFSRNEVLTPNEIRGKIGFRPSKESKSNKLLNSNMPTQETGDSAKADPPSEPTQGKEGDPSNDSSTDA